MQDRSFHGIFKIYIVNSLHEKNIFVNFQITVTVALFLLPYAKLVLAE